MQPVEGDACNLSGATVCSYGLCEARCIGGKWIDRCTPDAGPPDCPPSPPPHGSACSTPTGQYKCFYDACGTATQELASSSCDGQHWTTNYGLCNGPAGCVVAEDPPPCPSGNMCVSHFPDCAEPNVQGDISCRPDACVHEPFSCACAGFMCGSFHQCTEAIAGHVVCSDPPGLPPRIVISNIEDSPHSLTLEQTTMGWQSGLSGDIRVYTAADGFASTRVFGAPQGSVALGNGNLYYAATSALKSIPLPAGTDVLLGSNVTSPTQLTFDQGLLYWRGVNDVVRDQISTGTITSVVTNPSGARFGAKQGLLTTWIPGMLTQIDSAGTVLHALATSCVPSSVVAFDGSSVVCIDASGGPTDVRLYLQSIVTGAETDVTVHQPGVGETAIRNGRVFWIDGNHYIWGAHVGGSPKKLTNVNAVAQELTPTDTRLYWSTATGPLCGGVFGVDFP